MVPGKGSHFAIVRHGWERTSLFRVCSPACGGELARCEAARWRSRTEGAGNSGLAFVGSWSGAPPSRSNSCGPPPPLRGRGHIGRTSVAQVCDGTPPRGDQPGANPPPRGSGGSDSAVQRRHLSPGRCPRSALRTGRECRYLARSRTPCPARATGCSPR